MIIDDELKIYLSGGITNSDPSLSLGGDMSVIEAQHNLFNSVLNTNITSFYEDYRCVYLYNSSNTESIINLRILTSLDESGDESDLFLSVASEGKNQTVQNTTSAPVNQIFWPCTNDSTALSLGDLGPNDFIGVWLKRTILPNPKLKGSCIVNFFIKADTP